jgi:molecular chaperone DnaK
MSYHAGVDVGATYAAAAVCRSGSAEIIPLGRGGFPPSVIFASPDGSLLIGEDAERRAPTDPGRVARRFKDRVGDGTPLRVGGLAVTAEVLAARFVARMLDAVAERAGGPASRVAVTHPAGWGRHRLESFRTALAGQGLGSALLLSEPQAAVLAHASRERLSPGDVVAVYDLGGGSFDAAVVRMLAADRFMLVGRPEEVEVGGLDFDEAVFSHVVSALGPAWEALDPTDPAVLAAVAGLRRDCAAAKEALSADTDVLISVALPGIEEQVRLGRAEFEELIRPAVDETVEALHRALGSAGVTPDELASVLLVGGSARIPLITQSVSARLGRPVAVAADPKGVVAIGAALAANGLAAERTRVAPAPAIPVGATVYAPPGTRPPLPPRPAGKRFSLGRARTVIPAVSVSVLAAILVAVALAAGSQPIRPVDADADPATGRPTTGTVTVVEVTPSERFTPPTQPQTPRSTPPKNTRTRTPAVTTTPTPTATRPPTSAATPTSTTTKTTESRAGRP